jgi:prepilin-type N-terminal cleavage/methylation domain-containing protein
MKHRSGLTLVEVLVAIFVMGIGMLAILVLFPLGALNMARALKDDRCGTIAWNADSLAIASNLRTDPTLAPLLGPRSGAGGDPPPPAGFLPADPNGPGYPVYVDPYFWFNSVPQLTTVAGLPYVQRVAPQYLVAAPAVTRPLMLDRWFSLQDDLSFDPNGFPTGGNGPSVQRQGYYTWAYMLQRTQSSQQNTTQLWVIAYRGRAVSSPVVERSFTAAPPGSLGDTSITLTWPAGQAVPDLRRGSWIMDVTPETKPGTGAPPGNRTSVHCGFYRVMAATPTGANQMQVEVLPAFRNGNIQTVVVLDQAIEIFERGTAGY